MKRLERERLIHSNTYGVVEICKRRLSSGDEEEGSSDDERYVRKIISWDNRRYAAREISVGMLVQDHKHMVKLLESKLLDGGFHLVYELAKEGDLFDYLKKKPELRRDMSWVRDAFRQIIEGVNAMHESNIIHRDIKLENIIITEDGTFKVCDFSFSEWEKNPIGMRRTSSYGIKKSLREETGYLAEPEIALKKNTKTLVGTYGCISPETIETKKATKSTDIFALGVLLYEMITGVPAFPKNKTYVSLNYPLFIRIKQCCSGDLINLINRMTKVHVEERITLREVLKHPWMKKECCGNCLSK